MNGYLTTSLRRLPHSRSVNEILGLLALDITPKTTIPHTKKGIGNKEWIREFWRCVGKIS